MLRRLFSNGPIQSITAAASVVAVASLTSRFLGIFRDRVLAGEFGATETLDIYYAAFRLPDFLYNFLIFGALSAGFIPLLSAHHAKQQSKEVWEFTNIVLTIGMVIIIPLILILLITAPFLIKWIVVPGFSPEDQEVTVYLSRIMFLSPFFLGLSGILSGVLQSYKRFFIYSLAPIFYNVGIIIGALYFVPIYGIIGLAWGVVLGAFLHFAIQFPAVKALGWPLRFILKLKDYRLKELFRLMVPRTLTLLVVQSNLLVITFIASHLAEGSITVFNLANNLQSFPIGIIGISFAVAAFPTLSQYMAERKIQKFVESFVKSVSEILYFILPITVLVFGLRAQIVRIILGTGVFGWEATQNTLTALGYFSLSLFAQSLIPLFTRAFFAQKDSAYPFAASVIGLLSNIVFSYFFAIVEGMGVIGLALSFSLSSVLQLIVLWFGLHLRIGNLRDTELLRTTSKILIGVLAMIPVMQGMKELTVSFIPLTTFLGVFFQAAITGLVAIGVYIGVEWLVGSEEQRVLINACKRRMYREASLGDVGQGREV
jgi:putative peptidoglycan lipid II flippase